MLIKKILTEKAAGCLAGGAVGDALGRTVEFVTEDIIRLKYGKQGITELPLSNGKARFTDDTQLSLFTAEGLLRMHTRKILKNITPSYEVMLRSYHRWIITQNGGVFTGSDSIYKKMNQEQIDSVLTSGFLVNTPELNKMRAPGRTCIQALSSGEKFSFKNPPNSSKGCGAVMRAAPAGIFYNKSPEEAFVSGCELSVLTHGHPTGYIATGAFAMIISLIMSRVPLIEAVRRTVSYLKTECTKFDFIKAGNTYETVKALENTLSFYEKEHIAGKSFSRLGEGWTAEEALSIGIYCSLVNQENSFRDGITAAVNHSGDSDSTGSICGNILGAVKGLSSIPPDYREKIELYPLICEMAEDLICTEITDEFIKKYPGW